MSVATSGRSPNLLTKPMIPGDDQVLYSNNEKKWTEWREPQGMSLRSHRVKTLPEILASMNIKRKRSVTHFEGIPISIIQEGGKSSHSSDPTPHGPSTRSRASPLLGSSSSLIIQHASMEDSPKDKEEQRERERSSAPSPEPYPSNPISTRPTLSAIPERPVPSRRIVSNKRLDKLGTMFDHLDLKKAKNNGSQIVRPVVDRPNAPHSPSQHMDLGDINDEYDEYDSDDDDDVIIIV